MPEGSPSLDRKSFAVDLRRVGIAHIDFEDWDGLTDMETVRLIERMQSVVINPEVVKEYTREV